MNKPFMAKVCHYVVVNGVNVEKCIEVPSPTANRLLDNLKGEEWFATILSDRL